jgi:hypothetical protein
MINKLEHLIKPCHCEEQPGPAWWGNVAISWLCITTVHIRPV